MATYQFEALDQAGKQRKGSIEASSSDDAIQRIKTQGFFPTAVREKKTRGGSKAKTPKAAKAGKAKGGGRSISIGRVGVKTIMQFTRQLSTLQDAGLPIIRSLVLLTEQEKAGKFRDTLGAIQVDVEGGLALSDAMAKHPKVFDRLYTKMIAAGELGGVLDVILQRLAEFMEKAQRLKSKIIGAMTYPVVVVMISMLILIGIMTFIVPRFIEIFDSFDVDLPLPTQALINTSAFVAGTSESQLIPGWIYIVLSPLFIVGLSKGLKASEKGRKFLDHFKLRIPVLGNLMRLTAISRFTRTLGTLIHAGVPILDGLLITRDTVGNAVFEDALQKVHNSIREGESFANPLREAKVCDSLVVNMIDVGEETGELDKMLTKIADNYDEKIDTAVAALVSLIEPLMVVGLGGTIGSIVLALFMPMLSLIENVSK